MDEKTFQFKVDKTMKCKHEKSRIVRDGKECAKCGVAWNIALKERRKWRESRKGWYWRCGWEHSYFGRYHPDAEWCEARGRKPFKTKEEAEAAGQRHMATHGHADGRHSYNVNVWQE